MSKGDTEKLLEKMLLIIREKPGIRPSQLNRLLGIAHTWNLRKKLISKGLIIKKKEGSAVRYYPL